MNCKKLIGVALSAGLLIGVGEISAQEARPKNPAIAKAADDSWKAAKIYVSADLSQSGKACEGAMGSACEKSIKEGKHPVIVFMHGCGGQNNPATFMGHGAIVVAPVSSRGANTCDSTPEAYNKIILQRRADALIAVNALKAAPWTNDDKLVLAGYSQGARIAALYVRDDFMARIIVAWTCNAPKSDQQDGIRGKGPALAVLGSNDTYLKKRGIIGNCNEAVASRGGPSKSVIISGGTHDIVDHPQTRAAVKEFLAAVLK